MTNLIIFLLVIVGIYYGGKMLLQYAALKFIGNIHNKINQQQEEFVRRQRDQHNPPEEGEIRVDQPPTPEAEKTRIGDEAGEYIEFEDV